MCDSGSGSRTGCGPASSERTLHPWWSPSSSLHAPVLGTPSGLLVEQTDYVLGFGDPLGRILRFLRVVHNVTAASLPDLPNYGAD